MRLTTLAAFFGGNLADIAKPGMCNVGPNDPGGAFDPNDDMSGTRDLRGLPISDDVAMRRIEHRPLPAFSAGVDRSDGRRNADYDRSRPAQVEEPPEYREERRDGMAGGAPQDSVEVDTQRPRHGVGDAGFKMPDPPTSALRTW